MGARHISQGTTKLLSTIALKMVCKIEELHSRVPAWQQQVEELAQGELCHGTGLEARMSIPHFLLYHFPELS